MSSTLNSLGYKRKPVAVSSLDVGSLSKLNNWQMPVYAPSSIPKPPSNAYTAFFDSTNSNKLSVKDSTGTVTLVGGSSGSGSGDFQALVGPTETYTSVQAAVTAGFWRLRITGTFTEPGAISFAALSLNPDILISIDQGVTWTTANIITYTGGGNITFTGGGTFKYTVGGTGAIVLTTGKRVTFDACNIANAASTTPCYLTFFDIEVSILNSTVTLPNQTNCFINNTAFVYMNGCRFTGGGASMSRYILASNATILNLSETSFTTSSGANIMIISNSTCSNWNVTMNQFIDLSSCKVSNLKLSGSGTLLLEGCLASNISLPSGLLTVGTTASQVSIAKANTLSVSTSQCMLSDVIIASTSNLSLGTDSRFASCSFTGAVTFDTSQMFDNCLFGSGSAITINTGPLYFLNCSFNGNTTLGSTGDVHFAGCRVTGTLTVGTGSNHEVLNTEITSSIAVTGSQAQITNTRCTSMTVNATQCSIGGCVLSSTLSVGSSASAQGSVFSNNIVTSTTDTSANTNSDDLVFISNNLIGTVTVPAGTTANHEPLFTGNKIGAGGATATGPTNSHNNSGNNSRP